MFKRVGKYNNTITKHKDGTVTRSNRESRFKKKLDLLKIPYEQEKVFTIHEKYRYKGEAVRAITYKLDFLIAGIYAVEIKGFAHEVGKLKWKMFVHQYMDEYDCVFLPDVKAENEFLSMLATKFGK